MGDARPVLHLDVGRADQRLREEGMVAEVRGGVVVEVCVVVVVEVVVAVAARHLHELRAALVDDLRVELRVEREIPHRAHHELLQVGRARVPALDQRPQPAALSNLPLAPRVRQARVCAGGGRVHREWPRQVGAQSVRIGL